MENENKSVNINLTIEEANLVINSLSYGPYNEVVGLISKIAQVIMIATKPVEPVEEVVENTISEKDLLPKLPIRRRNVKG